MNLHFFIVISIVSVSVQGMLASREFVCGITEEHKSESLYSSCFILFIEQNLKTQQHSLPTWNQSKWRLFVRYYVGNMADILTYFYLFVPVQIVQIKHSLSHKWIQFHHLWLWLRKVNILKELLFLLWHKERQSIASPLVLFCELWKFSHPHADENCVYSQLSQKLLLEGFIYVTTQAIDRIRGIYLRFLLFPLDWH